MNRPLGEKIDNIVEGRLASLETLAWSHLYDWTRKDETIREHLVCIRKDLIALFHQYYLSKVEGLKPLSDEELSQICTEFFASPCIAKIEAGLLEHRISQATVDSINKQLKGGK